MMSQFLPLYSIILKFFRLIFSLVYTTAWGCTSTDPVRGLAQLVPRGGGEGGGVSWVLLIIQLLH